MSICNSILYLVDLSFGFIYKMEMMMLIHLPPESTLRTKYASAYKALGCAWQLGDIQNMLVIISVLCGSQITAQPFYFRGWSWFDVYVKALTLHALLSA